MHRLDFLDKLRAIAQNGLYYAKDPFDLERYTQLMNLATAGYAEYADLSSAEIKERFAKELGYITAKVGVQGVLINSAGEMLLEKRKDDGLWGLPSGWLDVGERPQEAIAREFMEEAQVRVEVGELLGVYSRLPGEFSQPHTSVHLLYACSFVGGQIQISHESLEMKFVDHKTITTWHKDHQQQAEVGWSYWAQHNSNRKRKQRAISLPHPNATITLQICLGSWYLFTGKFSRLRRSKSRKTYLPCGTQICHMFLRKLLQRISSSKLNIGAYLLEIMLIIFSILIAIQADRYQQNQRNQAKLQDYITAMHQDLLTEQQLNRNNLIDCLQDIKNIEASLRLSQMDNNDSLDLALQNFGQVINRGVFRAFPPTTYDIMLSTGDIALIKDLELRSRLASPFSFRETYTKRDLLDFDQHTEEVAEVLAQYGSLYCMVSTPKPHTCLHDRTGFINHFHNQLFILLTKARSRAFHLRIAIRYFDATKEELQKAYDLATMDAEEKAVVDEQEKE